MSATRTRAPYSVGDQLLVLHSTAAGATTYGAVPVLRVIPLNDNGMFRIECERTGGGALHVVVDRHGKDSNGYVTGRAA